MTQRNRKFWGVLLMLGSIVVVGAAATAIYLTWLTGQAPPMLIGFFAVTGFAWLIPAMAIIRWMSRPDAA